MDNTFRRRRRTTITHRRLCRRLCLRSGTAGAARTRGCKDHHTPPTITIRCRSHRTARLRHPPKDIPSRRPERIARTPLRTPIEWHTKRCLPRIHPPYSSHRTPDRHGRKLCSTRSSSAPRHIPTQHQPSSRHTSLQHHTPTRCLGRTPGSQATAPRRKATAPHRKATQFHPKSTPSRHRRATSAQSTAPCRPTASPRTQAGSGRTANFHPVGVHHRAIGGTRVVARLRLRVSSRRRRQVAAARLMPHPQLINTPQPHHVNIPHPPLIPRPHFAPHPHQHNPQHLSRS